jgi:hypothetical protein
MGIILLIASLAALIYAIVLMVRVANNENRRGWLWGIITFFMGAGVRYAFPEWSVLGTIGGAILSFLLMFALNMTKKTSY